MPFCTNCGHENVSGSKFCAMCGTQLAATGLRTEIGESQPFGETTRTMPAMVDDRDADGLSEEEEAAVGALPQGSALLIVQRGANAGSRFLLDTDRVSAGRHQDCDIFLDDISVSRRHASFNRTGDGIEVLDLGSLNGTYVNRELVDRALLRPGDEVQIGKFRLVFFASAEDAE